MTAKEWIETVLPGVVERLQAELIRLDPVPEKYRASPDGILHYHISRHTRVLTVTDAHEATVGGLPEPCPLPLSRCRAYALGQALLACEKGAPGIAANRVARYTDAVYAALPRIREILADISPPTGELEAVLRPTGKLMLPRRRATLAVALIARDALKESAKAMTAWLLHGPAEFSTETTVDRPGKKHHLHHIDRITAPLLGCYTDKEIAELVPDGEDPGEGGELAQARVANRRKKLTGSRKGGRPGKPGRPRKALRET